MVMAVLQLAVATQFREVTARHSERPRFVADVTATAARLRQPLLAWVGLYVVAQVVAVHLIAELTAPYLTGLFGDRPDTTAWAAMTTGIVTATVATVAAVSLRGLVPLSRRFGLAAVLLGVGLLPVTVTAAMALVSSVWVLPLLSVRRVQAATASVLVPSLIGSRVEPKHRATLLSMLSLAGRLSYTGALIALAGAAGDDLAQSLWLAAGVVAGLWLLVAFFQRRVADFPQQSVHDHDHHHDELEHDHLHTHGDGHHDHEHDPPVEGPHRHRHQHEAHQHSHPHVSDDHHRHDH